MSKNKKISYEEKLRRAEKILASKESRADGKKRFEKTLKASAKSKQRGLKPRQT